MTRNQKILLIVILILGSFFLFFRLGRPDMLGDDATYAFRSIKYFDYMGSEKQTTPVQWFGQRPIWSYLSFHDHPPLYFLIHFLVFSIFGVSTLIARFPSALAALGSIVLIFIIGRKLGGDRLGIWSAIFLTLNNFFIWTGRVGYLESIFIFFMLIGVYYLVRAFTESESYLKYAAFFLGLAFLTKYTLLLMLPGLLVYVLWKKRALFAKRVFWQAVLIFILTISPVLVFNLFVFTSRGHFDVQFDRLIPFPHSDWDILKNSGVGSGFVLPVVISNLANGFSQPYFILFVFSLIVAIFGIWRGKRNPIFALPILIVFSFTLGFAATNPAERLLGVISPFVALILAAGTPNNIKQLPWIALVSLVLVFSAFNILNTNHFSVFQKRNFKSYSKIIFSIFSLDHYFGGC